jgi:hypothetical protein
MPKLVAVHIGELGLTQRSQANTMMRGGATVMLIFRRIEERGFRDPFSHSSSSLSSMNLKNPKPKACSPLLKNPEIAGERRKKEKKMKKEKKKKKEERESDEKERKIEKKLTLVKKDTRVNY